MWFWGRRGRLGPSTQDRSKLLFVACACSLAFLHGIVVAHYRVFPFSVIQYGKESFDLVWAEIGTILGREPPVGLLEEARYDGTGVTRFDRNRAFPGLTLLGGFFDHQLEFRLIRLDGTVVARWPARFSQLFPDPDHIKPVERIPTTDWNVGVQGSRLFQDGSLIFTFEGMGTAKFDRCAQVQWTLPEMTHHSVESAADGAVWIPSMEVVEDSTRFAGLRAPYDEDTILKVSADGQVLEEISVLDVMFRNDLQPILFANGLATLKVPGRHSVTHLNDIEELTPEMARHFPTFSAGDLLLSLRNYNLVLVVDPDTLVVKWHQMGPWLKQHDPDFQPDGSISVFSNNPDGTDAGTTLGGSTLIDIDPVTRLATLRYGGRPSQRFYTGQRGKHQQLPNGNELIVESHAGRVFEINPGGEVVWEFINRYGEDNVTVLSDATRYPTDYFAFDDWRCH